MAERPDPAPGHAPPHAPKPSPATQRAVLRLREQGPVLLAQVISVVFAVLVALAVDEWWENRENEELGRQAMRAVAAELRGNLEELTNEREQLTTQLDQLDANITDLRADRELVEVNVNYPVALLSSAAWQTAQVTRAVHFVDLDRTVRIARVYDLQNFFLRAQEGLSERIAGFGNVDESNLLPALRDTRHRYALVAGYRTGLIQAYQCLLAELENPTAPAPQECRDEDGGS